MDTQIPIPKKVLTGNPYRGLLQELHSGQISKEDFHMALYTAILQDNAVIGSFHPHPFPTRPPALIDAERDLGVKIDKMRENDIPRELLAEEEAKARTKLRTEYTGYYFQKDKIVNENMGNRIFLEEMYSFLKDRNDTMAIRVKEILNAHYESC